MAIFNEDKSIINKTLDVQAPQKEVRGLDVLSNIAFGPPVEDLEIKKNFLIDLYGNIVQEYDKIMKVLRVRAAADPNTIMNLNTQPPEVIAAAQKLFGENVAGISFDRYLDLLKLERDLNAICVKEELEGGILDA